MTHRSPLSLAVPTREQVPRPSDEDAIPLTMLNQLPVDTQLALLTHVINRAETCLELRREEDRIRVFLELHGAGFRSEWLDWLRQVPVALLSKLVRAHHANKPLFAVMLCQENFERLLEAAVAELNPSPYHLLLHEFVKRGASMSMLRRYFNMTQPSVMETRKQLGIHVTRGREPLPNEPIQYAIVSIWREKAGPQGPTRERERLVWLHERCSQAHSLAVLHAVLGSELSGELQEKGT